ncbi:MAG: 7-cyano-7-deazaguanine synthase QueC [Oligoflexales bacterium]
MKTVLSFSGGLDSTVLLYHLLDQGDEVVCLNFCYGSKHNETERKSANEICRQANIPCHNIDLPFLGKLFSSDLLIGGGPIPLGHYEDESMRQTVVPYRNGILLSIAVGYAESIDADRVALANHAGDHAIYPDCRPEWVQAMNLASWHGTYNHISIHTPFTHKHKGEICELGIQLGAPLQLTWTCYQGGEIPCGECGSCNERKEAFEYTGTTDPILPWGESLFGITPFPKQTNTEVTEHLATGKFDLN